MSFDSIVANAGRLRILTALAVEDRLDFVHLRRLTQLTDGNLSAHARRLASAGLLGIDKHFREGKPVTSVTLTAEGRAALEAHARRLMAAISHRRLAAGSGSGSVGGAAVEAEDQRRTGDRPRAVAAEPVVAVAEEPENWVD